MPLAELHPLALHFAAALLVAGPAFDAAGLLLRREALLQAGRWNTLAGTLACALAVVSGLAAEGALGPHTRAGTALLSLHHGLGYLLLGIWAPVSIWRAASRLALPLRLRTLYLAFAFAGAALVLGETALGSSLVFRHGVGVSREAREVKLPPAPPQGEAKAN